MINETAHAFLFDMDGTLVDSTAVVERTWQRFSKRYALNADEILEAAHGRPTAETIALFAPAEINHASVTATVIAEEVADVVGIKAVPGALELLQQLPENRYAIVTSASYDLAVRRLQAAGLPIPKTMVTADDVSFGKPHPQGYLLAAKQLAVTASQCLVFEDAEVGVMAAKNAAMRYVSVGDRIMGSAAFKCSHHPKWLQNFNNLQLTIPASLSQSMTIQSIL